MLQSMGSQRVGHDLVTEKQEYKISGTGKFTGARRRSVFTRGWREAEWQSLLDKHRVCVWVIEKF